MEGQDTTGAQTAAPEAAQTQAPEYQPVLDRVEQIGQQLNPVLDYVQQQQQQQQQGQQGQGYDDAAFMPGYDPYGGYQEQPYEQQAAQGFPEFAEQQGQGFDQQQLLGSIGQMVNNAVQQAVAPYEAERAEARFNEQVSAVESRVPDLRDPQKAEAAVEKAFERAQALAGGLPRQLTQQIAAQNPGLDIAQVIAMQPGFVEMTFLAERAMESAAQETPAGGSQGQELEAGGAAAQQAQEPSPASQWLQGAGEQPERSLSELW